jgi:hypothetical protein
MTIHELLRFLSERLETLQVAHLITGSMASVAFGEPRFTNDIDSGLGHATGRPGHLAGFARSLANVTG